MHALMLFKYAPLALVCQKQRAGGVVMNQTGIAFQYKITNAWSGSKKLRWWDQDLDLG